ncbi:MAG TPA: DegT/DnrJ/EryC1/StrS aminotransferase family protein [Spirochaetes bacterium]|nr:DegT/DnrJ/EryC1/StrS aminotransferase family protein [Spirochaetota bacterium]
MLVNQMIKFYKPSIGKKDLESVLYCMIGDDLRPGDHLKTFSSMLCRELDLSNTIVFSIYLHTFENIFHLIDAAPGDEVILPSFARYGILHAIEKCRLEPVLVDLADDSLLPSIGQIRKKISKSTCCLFIPQMFGIPNDLSDYHEFQLPLIEDIDGSIGSRVNRKPVGNFGTFVTMNFNDNSMLVTGGGGLVASGDKRLKHLAKSIKENLSYEDYLMSDFNASLGISQLNQLKRSLEIRRNIGQHYDNAVMASGCSLVGRDEAKELSFSSYVVKTQTPFKDCKQSFKRSGIPVKRGIEKPLHSFLDLGVAGFSNTEEMNNKLVSLPIYPGLSSEDIENIVKGIRTIL